MAGTPTWSSRARAMSRASRKRARGLPRWSTTESSESTHSLVSGGSMSGSECEYPSMITLPAYGLPGTGCAGLSAGPGYAPPSMGTMRIAAALVVLTLTGACGGDGGGNKGDAPAALAGSTSPTAAPDATTTSAPAGSSTTTARQATPKTTVKPAAASPTTVSTGRTSGPVQTGPHATVFVTAAPTDPAELDRLADQLAADETALRAPATPAADIPALAHRQQAAYRALSARPAALPAVLARLPEWLRPIARANVDAGAELRSMTQPKGDLP